MIYQEKSKANIPTNLAAQKACAANHKLNFISSAHKQFSGHFLIHNSAAICVITRFSLQWKVAGVEEEEVREEKEEIREH